MKINLRIKSVRYAKYLAEFLYKLHPVVLKEQLNAKKEFGNIFGMIDLNNMDYDKREQLANLTFNKEQITNKILSCDEISEEVKKELEEKLKYDKYLNDISKSERKDFINLDFYTEVEDRQYGRMLSEFLDNLTEGCLEQAVLSKREEDEDAKFIGRYLEVGDLKTEEECKILRENRFGSK